MEKILYVGGFVLPDKNAAAQRVVSIAKGLYAIGHEVLFLNYSEISAGNTWKEYFGFQCYETMKQSKYRQLTDITDVKRIIVEKQITSVIAYNYPATALYRLIRYCMTNEVKCYADVTEWYVAAGKPIFRLIKTIDTEIRMRILHPHMDGVIAISEYLYRYYCEKVKTVKIPPTVDLSEEKWESRAEAELDDKTVIVYAGSPSFQKERLDLILDAAEFVAVKNRLVLCIIGITQKQYMQIYGKPYTGTCAKFLGKLNHIETIQNIKSADWTIAIRENNKVVRAGFPTKVVESISCGTPVIANHFSNLEDYLNERNSFLCDCASISDALQFACNTHFRTCCETFKFENFTNQLNDLFSE